MSHFLLEHLPMCVHVYTTCIYHQNVILALDTTQKYVPEIPLYSKSFAEGCLVSSDEKCWYGNCDHDTCSFDSTYEKLQNSDDPAKWMKWEEVNGRIIKIKKVVQLAVYTITCTLYFQIFSYIHLWKENKQKAMKMINLKLPWKIQTLLCCRLILQKITCVLLKMKSNQHIGNRIKSHYSPQLCGLEKTLNVK